MINSCVETIIWNTHHCYFGDIATSSDIDRHCRVLHNWLEQLHKQYVANSIVACILVDVPLSTLLVPIQELLNACEFLEFVDKVIVW